MGFNPQSQPVRLLFDLTSGQNTGQSVFFANLSRGGRGMVNCVLSRPKTTKLLENFIDLLFYGNASNEGEGNQMFLKVISIEATFDVNKCLNLTFGCFTYFLPLSLIEAGGG